MQHSLSIVVTLLLSLTSGIAIWGPDAALGSEDGERAGAAVSPPVVARAGVEEELAQALLRLLDDDQGARAVVGDRAGPAVMLRAAVGPATLRAQRGLPWSAMTEPQRALAWWLLRRCADAAAPGGSGTALARLEGAVLDELSFAWAGGTDRADGAYCRLHAPGFAVEYYRAPGAATVHLEWRDFARDAGAPWLCERLAADLLRR